MTSGSSILKNSIVYNYRPTPQVSLTRDWVVVDEEWSYSTHSKFDQIPSLWIPIILTITSSSLLWSAVPRIAVSLHHLYLLYCSLRLVTGMSSPGFSSQGLCTCCSRPAMLLSEACTTLSSTASICPGHLWPPTPGAHAFPSHLSPFPTAMLLLKTFSIPSRPMLSVYLTPLRQNLNRCLDFILELEECRSQSQQKFVQRMGLSR